MYILWNNYICTEKQHIALLIYKSSTYHVWRQISTWNNISMPYWLQRFPQSSISNLVRQGPPLHPPKHHHLLHTDSSMKGLRAHTDNLKVSVLWTPSQAQNHSKTTTASDSPSSEPLEFGRNGSESVIPVESNNSTACSGFSPLTKTLLMSALEDNIIVHMRFIPGSMNAIMDTLSRKNKLVPT